MAGIAPVVTAHLMVVIPAVPMVNLTVVPKAVHMVSASMAHGHVTVMLTVPMDQMKPIAAK